MTSQTLAVIDYGMGNLHSVASALSHVAPEIEVQVTSEPEVIARADRVVFPGVGAIGECMKAVRKLGFDHLLRQQVAAGKPVLGVCVGMQALLQRSEESAGVDCIGQLPGQVRFFVRSLTDTAGRALKVPHMGWNKVRHNGHPLWAGIEQDARFYFVHSYYVDAAEPEQVAATCDYGHTFAAALQRNNLFAVQFHPEKSHTAGLQLLRNFVAWNGQA